MAMIIEELKVYLIGMEYPRSLNDPSPAKVIPLAGDWRTEDARRTTRNIRRAHKRVDLVLHYDAVSYTAVIFLSTSFPTQPQSYVPWEGTPRLPFQTTEFLQTLGGDFRSFLGYLNFTHAFKVIVLQPDSVTSGTYPGLACITNILDRGTTPPRAVDIYLPPFEVELLKELHASYWSGKRYSSDGMLIDGGDGRDEIHSEEPSSDQSKFELCRKRTALRSDEDENIRVENSYKLARALAWEEFRNHQITMVDSEAGSVDMDMLPKCVLVPLTEEDLQRGEFSAYESLVGFSWERELSSHVVSNNPALQVT